MSFLDIKPYEMRRFQNILAFKFDNEIIGFHSTNLEVAELTEEFFKSMTPISIHTSEAPDLLLKNTNDEVTSEINEWNEEINSEAKSGQLDFNIRSLTLNVNQICNLKCHYCAAGGDGTYGSPTNKIEIEKTLPQLKWLTEKLLPKQKFSITFVGGEPLLHPEAIHSICQYILDLSVEKKFIPVFTVVTNGTLLQGKTLSILNSLPINLTISIDGDIETNDKVRPSKNGQSSTLEIIKSLQEFSLNKGMIQSLNFASVFDHENSDVLRAYRFLKQFNPNQYEFNFSVSESSLTAQLNFINGLKHVAKEAFTNGGESELRKIKDFNTFFRLLDSQLKLENFCGAGKSYLVMDAKNNLYTCPWEVGKKDEIVGDNKQLNTDMLSNYSKSLIELNNCHTCWAKHLCGGGCMYINKVHSGDKHSKNKLFCERTRSLILEALLYYKLARTSE